MTITNLLALTKLTTSVVLLALFLRPTSAFAQPEYGITDLGSIGRASDKVGAMAINDRGEVAGGNGHAFLWCDSKMTSLGGLLAVPEDPMGGSNSVAYGINNRGVIVGCSGSFSAMFGTGLASERAFIAGSEGLRELTKNSQEVIPYAINDSGQIAGVDQFRGFFFSLNVLVPLGTFSHVPNGNRSSARSLNQQGQVVGWSTVGTLPVKQFGPLATHAFLWQRHGLSGRMRDLGTLPGWVNSYAYGINRRSEIVGSASDASAGTNGSERASHSTAFLWRSGKMAGLGTLPGCKNSQAFGINDSTAVVGTADNRAFLWKQGRMLDLNAFISSGSGWTLEEARAINNRDQIVGSGKLHGQAHMFLLTPITYS